MSLIRSVLVIGAQGGVGSATARAFEDAGWEVRRAGRRLQDGPGMRFLDLDDPRLDALLEPADVIVNTVPHEGLVPERATLERGGVLIRIPEAPPSVTARLRGEPPDAGLVVVNAGIFPGVSTLVAVELLKCYPDADAVMLALTVSARATSGRAGGATLHRWLSMRPRHATEVIPFPPPFGRRRCLQIAEDDDGCLGGHLGGRAVWTGLCFAERPLHVGMLGLERLGLLSKIPRYVLAAKPANPDKLSREPFAVWVGATRDGALLGARTIEGRGDYRCTAASTVLVAERLTAGDDRATRTGCIDLAEVFTLDDLCADLQAAGVTVSDS